MRNPLNQLFTHSEQRAMLFLILVFLLGVALQMVGFTPSAKPADPAMIATLQATTVNDVPLNIDIRVAKASELELLPGIGAKRAADIISYRQNNPFKSVNELMNVKGIGVKTYQKMLPMLLVFGDSTAVEPKQTSAKSAAAKPEKASSTSKADDNSPVNINSGGVAELSKLQGIGEAKAKAIIDYRKENGPFQSIEDLVKVKGIGVKTLENNRHRLRI